MSNYHYLDVTLELPKGLRRDIPALFFKKHVIQSMSQLFGEVGANTTVDLLKYNSITHRAVLRVPSAYYVKLRSSLTFAAEYEGVPCAYHVEKSSTYLPNLLGDSRTYVHEGKTKRPLVRVMSHCKKTGPNGKDIIIFTTKEDHEKPSTVELPPPESPSGLILDDGSINWNCPCLGGMATGPCGVEFRQAFSCFHYSQAEPKGSDCLETFQAMQDCMKQFPILYKQATGEDGDGQEESSMMNMGAIDSEDNNSQPTKEKVMPPEPKTVSVQSS